jgi:hypothetical protein
MREASSNLIERLARQVVQCRLAVADERAHGGDRRQGRVVPRRIQTVEPSLLLDLVGA